MAVDAVAAVEEVIQRGAGRRSELPVARQRVRLGSSLGLVQAAYDAGDVAEVTPDRLDVLEPDTAKVGFTGDVALVPVDVAMVCPGKLAHDAPYRVDQVRYGDQAPAQVEDGAVADRVTPAGVVLPDEP